MNRPAAALKVAPVPAAPAAPAPPVPAMVRNAHLHMSGVVRIAACELIPRPANVNEPYPVPAAVPVEGLTILRMLAAQIYTITNNGYSAAVNAVHGTRRYALAYVNRTQRPPPAAAPRPQVAAAAQQQVVAVARAVVRHALVSNATAAPAGARCNANASEPSRTLIAQW